MGLVATPFSSRRSELPTAPPEIAEEVELYARQSGRHATLHFIPVLLQGNRVVAGTWMAKITLRSDDKRMQLYQQGKVGKPPTEDVWFHVPNERAGEPGQLDYTPLNIHEMGASGVKQFLERGNTWSGRGQFASIEEQARKAMEANKEMRTSHREQQKEASRLEQREKRRRRLKIPLLPVGIDLSKKSEE